MVKLHPYRISRTLMIWTCIAVLLSLSFTAAAQDELEDPILNAAREAGLITEIGETQTQGEVTITLDWAYADTQRIVLGYTLQPAKAINRDDWGMSMISTSLKDDKQASFSYAGGSSKDGKQPDQLVVVIEYYTQAIIPVEGSQDFTVNNDYFNPPPDKINLTFDPKLTPIGAESALPFAFHFTVPLHPPIVIDQEQTIKVKDVSLTLDKLTITPTSTTAHICFTPPDARDWMLEGTINMGDKVGYPSGGTRDGGKGAVLSKEKRCGQYNFRVFHDHDAATLSLNFDHLAVSMNEGPDDWNKIKAELAKRNIQIEVISVPHALDVKVLNVPEGIDYDQAVLDARESLGDLVNGPWTFKVDLP